MARKINPIQPGLFEGDWAWGRGEVQKVPDNVMKFGGVVENHKLINLESFNWPITSSLHHNDFINVKIWRFYKNLTD